MRAGPTHEYVDAEMKQKVANTILHRVVGPEEHYGQPQQQYGQQNVGGQQQNFGGQQQNFGGQQQYGPQQGVSNGPKVCWFHSHFFVTNITSEL